MTEENKQFIKDNYLTMLDREMAEVIGVQRSTVSSWCRRMGLKRPKEIKSQRMSHTFTEERRKRYQELALTNENMIKSRFKKGNKGYRFQPIGTKRKDKRDGYWQIKVDDKPHCRDNWQYLHRIVWEKHYGAIPPNHHIVFLDGNKDNLSIENLYMIDDKTFAVMNRHYKFTSNPNITKTYIDIAKLKVVIGNIKRSTNGQHKQ